MRTFLTTDDFDTALALRNLEVTLLCLKHGYDTDTILTCSDNNLGNHVIYSNYIICVGAGHRHVSDIKTRIIRGVFVLCFTLGF